MSATEIRRDGPVVADRPSPGTPRPYEFPTVAEHHLDNGLRRAGRRPARPAARVRDARAAQRRRGRAAPTAGGATVLAARALSEGTERYDAIGLIEASERLGASIHAEAGWDAFSASLDVPADRLPQALELLAEMLLRPTFPADEVARLRDERLNDILQAKADPRRRAEEAFVDTIYAPERAVPPALGRHAGDRRGARRRTILRAAWSRGLDPARATLVVGGDLDGARRPGHRGAPVRRHAGRAGTAAASGSIDDTASSAGRIVRVVHRPGSVQTEIRIGHRGLPRRIDGLPRGLRDGRDPRRAVQLAAEHEAPRGEGLHVRRGRRLRPAPRRRPVRGPGRGQHRGDGAGHRRHARGADPDARDRRRAVRADRPPGTS